MMPAEEELEGQTLQCPVAVHGLRHHVDRNLRNVPSLTAEAAVKLMEGEIVRAAFIFVN